VRLVRIGVLAMFAWPLAANAASVPWRVTESKDATADDVRRTAIVSNEGGFTFSVYTVASKTVWANFTIPESDSALLDGQKLIVYQVDDYPPQTQDSNRFGEKVMHMHLIDAQPKLVNWVIGARGSSGLKQTLRQLQGGQRLIARFYLITGGSRDTEFTLAGAREALAEVAGVPATWDVADEQRPKEQLKRRLDTCRRRWRIPSLQGQVFHGAHARGMR
jgi:hypothetical protein